MKKWMCIVCMLMALLASTAQAEGVMSELFEKYPEAEEIYQQKIEMGVDSDTAVKAALSRKPDWEEDLLGFWESSGQMNILNKVLLAEVNGVNKGTFLRDTLDGILFTEQGTYLVTGARNNPEYEQVTVSQGFNEDGIYEIKLFSHNYVREMKFIGDVLLFEGYKEWAGFGATTYVKSMSVDEFAGVYRIGNTPIGIESCGSVSLKNRLIYQPGNTVKFGVFTRESGEKAAIGWRVLTVKDDRALLLSESVWSSLHLDEVTDYLEKNLENWFTEDEIRQMALTTNGDGIPCRLFLPERYELTTYFSDEEGRIACSMETGLPSGWWTDVNGDVNNKVAVSSEGKVYWNGALGSETNGVRPMMWLNLGDVISVEGQEVQGNWLIQKQNGEQSMAILRNNTIMLVDCWDQENEYSRYCVSMKAPYLFENGSVRINGMEDEVKIEYRDDQITIEAEEDSWWSSYHGATGSRAEEQLLGLPQSSYEGVWHGSSSDGTAVLLTLKEDGKAFLSSYEDTVGYWGINQQRLMVSFCVDEEAGLYELYAYGIGESGDKLTAPWAGNMVLRKQQMQSSGFMTTKSDEGITISGWNPEAQSIPENLVIPAEIGGIPVVHLSNGAFRGCENLRSVVIDGEMTVGEEVFAECEMLETADVSKVKNIGAKMFSMCSSLTNVTLPETVTDYADDAFEQCSALTELVVPEGATKLRVIMLFDCKELKDVYVPESATNFGDLKDALRSERVRNNYVSQRIAFHVYQGSQAEQSLSYTYNGQGYKLKYRSSGEDDLNKILINEGVLEGENITWKHYQDSSLVFSGTGMLSSGDYRSIATVSNIIIEEGITEIGKYAFSQMKCIEEITIPDSVKSIGEGAFYKSSIESVNIPSGVKRIEDSAFSAAFALKQITFSEGLESIGKDAFYCATMESVKLPEGLLCIGDKAFNTAYELKWISIPSSVTSIGARAFANCKDLIAYVEPGSYAESYCLENRIQVSYDEIPE